MESIAHSSNMRYLPHEVKTREYAVKLYRSGNSVRFVCRKYHISKPSLMRWNKRYTGDRSSLADRSHQPRTEHPNAHTEQELAWIRNLWRRNPNSTCLELYGKLLKRGYTRNPNSLYRVMRRLGYITKPKIKNTSKYVPKPYDTPKTLGVKWQIDVKHVPKACLSKGLAPYTRYYQYTCLDEASRERFIYFYDEQTPMATVNFVQKAAEHFGYQPKEIQTDNGMEFTWNVERNKCMHPVDVLCQELHIKHHKIRPRTPRHNGKVERSHRTDNERFYSRNIFFSLEDLRKKGAKYLKQYNTTPMRTLNYKTPCMMRDILFPISFS